MCTCSVHMETQQGIKSGFQLAPNEETTIIIKWMAHCLTCENSEIISLWARPRYSESFGTCADNQHLLNNTLVQRMFHKSRWVKNRVIIKEKSNSEDSFILLWFVTTLSSGVWCLLLRVCINRRKNNEYVSSMLKFTDPRVKYCYLLFLMFYCVPWQDTP